MKSFIVVLALVAIAAADVSHIVKSADANAEIESQNADVYPDQYQYSYKTSNGIFGQESGSLVNVGREDESIAVQGQNEYTAPDGQKIRISYSAGPNGYEPQGDHLPTPPPAQPIPDYILRAIEYIRTHPAKPEGVQKY